MYIISEVARNAKPFVYEVFKTAQSTKHKSCQDAEENELKQIHLDTDALSRVMASKIVPKDVVAKVMQLASNNIVGTTKLLLQYTNKNLHMWCEKAEE